MENAGHDPGMKKILITGGTSGLGLELVRLFLEKGYSVVAAGRDPSKLPDRYERLEFVRVDFGDLKGSAEIIEDITGKHCFSTIINNAGILSPFLYRSTADGFEYTFQVNFLTHLLLNEIIIKNKSEKLPLLIVAITSPAYRLHRLRSEHLLAERDYNPAKAYSGSKYLLSLMCRNLSSRHSKQNVIAISFDPGIFRSAIFRMQNPWFRSLYRIAAPFMRSPAKVARILKGILDSNNIDAGKIYNLRKKAFSLPVSDNGSEEVFWDCCLEKIRPFLNTRL